MKWHRVVVIAGIAVAAVAAFNYLFGYMWQVPVLSSVADTIAQK